MNPAGRIYTRWMVLTLLLSILLPVSAAAPWTPSMPPPLAVADTAPLIEAVGITDRPRQQTVSLLIEDFGWDWQRLVAIHASRMPPPRGDDSAWKQAHRAAE